MKLKNLYVLLALLAVGCTKQGGSQTGTAEAAETPAEVQASAISTVGPDSGAKLYVPFYRETLLFYVV
jgi:hypothetical protein